MRQLPPWMRPLKEKDPEFCDVVSALLDKANQPGALDAKTKTLILMAIDASGGHRDGVKALAGRARSLGASDAEIAEALRMAVVVSGVPGLIAGLAAYE